ncbi:PREDICTED: interleukin-2 receptor subunit alpha-like [Haliaeetus leucocephalus]|uniref:interleukin-2 receptor subunit alpha-like n=1 Tax=Haliaeetus leucocephalus TaxID=52644 RepID=UPI00053CEB63|nr:PREDICTED: interleukin-2 receptor subunit alpha-like [Haliaeetus leucocephalus]
MELKCLLMWLLFGSVKGNQPEKCPPLPRTKFADITADTYALGTRLYYECDSGYKRRSGQYPGIRCQSTQHVASWVYKEFECINETILLSTAPMMELDFTQKPENKTESPAPQRQESLSEFDQKDFCGPPKTIPHASLSQNAHYYLEQVLHFKCQSGYDKQSPTSGTSTCKKVNGKIIWTHLDVRCTNDSDGWPTQIITPVAIADPRFDSSTLFLICDTASDRENFLGNCGIQIQTHEIDDLPQKKPVTDCTSDSKTSSGK